MAIKIEESGHSSFILRRVNPIPWWAFPFFLFMYMLIIGVNLMIIAGFVALFLQENSWLSFSGKLLLLSFFLLCTSYPLTELLRFHFCKNVKVSLENNEWTITRKIFFLKRHVVSCKRSSHRFLCKRTTTRGGARADLYLKHGKNGYLLLSYFTSDQDIKKVICDEKDAIKEIYLMISRISKRVSRS